MRTSFPKNKIKVVLLEGVHELARERIAAEGFSVETLPAALGEADLINAIGDAHAVGIRSKTQISGAVLAAAPRLLAVGCFCIGTNQVDLGAAAHRGVPVFNSPFGNTRSVAELTMAEIIALHRRLMDRSAAMHAGRWEKSAAGSHEIRGRTLGIVGYGHIGSQVSVLAESLGMRVVYHDAAPKLGLGNAVALGSLNELLEQSDVVSLHVPASDATAGLIGRSQLARMKHGALLINNARDSVVDVAALAAALRDGSIGGAAVDVFPAEPKASGDAFDSELRGLPNVILTPHVGGSTVEAQASIAGDVASKLTRFINNGSTMGAVNVPQVDLPEQHRGDSPRPHRILNFHRNVPGVLSKIHAVAAELGVNVAGEYLQTQDELGFVVLEVDQADGAVLLDAIKAIPESIRMRALW